MNRTSMPSDAQLSIVQALICWLADLGDEAWAIRADILVACGTTKLAGLPAATVDRLILRLKGRIELIGRAH